MIKAGLVRVDSRLLHGQVVTRWIGQTNAKEVIIFDDALAKDDFMIEVFQMAAPSGVTLIVKSIDEIPEFLSDRVLNKSIILFKSIPMVLKAMTTGIKFERLQIGGIGGGPDRTVVFKNITLTKDEFDELIKLQQEGTDIYLQTVPEEREVKLEDIKNKF